MADAFYNEFKERLGDGGHDLDGDILSISLHGSNFINDSADNQIDDVAATQTSGTGYTALGTSLENVTWVLSGGVVELDATDPAWVSATFTADFGVIRAASGVNSGGLICALDLGGTQSVNNGTFTVLFNAAGLINLN